MANKTVKVAFSNKNTVTIPSYNVTGLYDPVNTGLVLSNLLDTTGTTTGLNLHVEASCHGTTGSSGNADANLWDIPVDVWRYVWRITSSTKTGKLRISNFIPGQTVNIDIAGHTNTALTTNFSFNGLPTLYPYVGKVKPPNEPIKNITVNADSSGNIYIDAARVGLYGSINFIHLTYDPNPAVLITSVTNLKTGQIATVTLNNPSYIATQAILSDGVVTKTIPVTGSNGNFTFLVPDLEDEIAGLKYGSLNIQLTDDAVLTSSFSATLLPYDNTTTVTLTGVDAYNYGQAAIFEPPLKIGSQILYNNSHILIDPEGILSGSFFVGTTVVWDRDPTNGIWRSTTVQIINESTDVPPEMPNDQSIEIFENTTYLGQFLATSGTSPITYTLSGINASLFNINSTTGVVSFKNPAVISAGSIIITATNLAGTSSQTVTYTVVENSEEERVLRLLKGMRLQGHFLTGKLIKGKYL